MKSHAEGKKNASSVNVSKGQSLLATFSRRMRFLQRSAVLRKAGKHEMDLLSVERQNKNQGS